MKLCVHAYVAGAVATAGVVGGAYAAFRVYKRIQATRLPQKWKLVGTLQDINVFPVKSCGGVKLNKAECTHLGLRSGWIRDRVLMITDTKTNRITARDYPKLLLIATNVNDSVLTLTHSDMEPLCINLAEIIESSVTSKTAYEWGVPVPVFDCGFGPSEWLSRCISKSAGEFRLVYYASKKSRQLGPSVNAPMYNFKKTDTGSFPDEAPYNLINDASVQDLNEKLEDKNMSHGNLRSNFTLKPLEGAKAFEEDDYRFVKIGENIFEIIKACESDRQFESPAESHSAGTAPRVGIQLALRSGPGGLVSLNDPVFFGNN